MNHLSHNRTRSGSGEAKLTENEHKSFRLTVERLEKLTRDPGPPASQYAAVSGVMDHLAEYCPLTLKCDECGRPVATALCGGCS